MAPPTTPSVTLDSLRRPALARVAAAASMRRSHLLLRVNSPIFSSFSSSSLLVVVPVTASSGNVDRRDELVLGHRRIHLAAGAPGDPEQFFFRERADRYASFAGDGVNELVLAHR